VRGLLRLLARRPPRETPAGGPAEGEGERDEAVKRDVPRYDAADGRAAEGGNKARDGAL